MESLKRLFPLLDLYYRLEPSHRTRFRIAYGLHNGERGAPVRVSLVGDTPTPLLLSAGSDRRRTRRPDPGRIETQAERSSASASFRR